MMWPWCPRHDAPYVARREGFICPWAIDAAAIGTEFDQCDEPTTVVIAHLNIPYPDPTLHEVTP